MHRIGHVHVILEHASRVHPRLQVAGPALKGDEVHKAATLSEGRLAKRLTNQAIACIHNPSPATLKRMVRGADHDADHARRVRTNPRDERFKRMPVVLDGAPSNRLVRAVREEGNVGCQRTKLRIE